MNFSRKTQFSSEIPTSSMPDIIFMLLIFFMVLQFNLFNKYSNSFVGMKVSRRDSGITYIGSITKISSNDFTASFDDGKVLDYSFRGWKF